MECKIDYVLLLIYARMWIWVIRTTSLSPSDNSKWQNTHFFFILKYSGWYMRSSSTTWKFQILQQNARKIQAFSLIFFFWLKDNLHVECFVKVCQYFINSNTFSDISEEFPFTSYILRLKIKRWRRIRIGYIKFIANRSTNHRWYMIVQNVFAVKLVQTRKNSC